jgi:hypothetical protein
MGKERFKRDSDYSFFGHFPYEHVVPREHFLVKLNERSPGSVSPAGWSNTIGEEPSKDTFKAMSLPGTYAP